MTIKKPGKRLKEVCKALGDPYTIRFIDFGYVIYRDLGNGYDIEIGGLNSSRRRFLADVYVWAYFTKKPGYHFSGHTVENRFDIKTFEDLQRHLDAMVDKWSKAAPPTSERRERF